MNAAAVHKYVDGNLAHSAPATEKVFVVDDDISIRESLDSLIRCAGWEPVTFASAEDFLSHPRPRVPSCLILDLRLPCLDGLGVQRRLTANRAILPIIFITYYGDPAMTVQAMKAGALEVLGKPFSDDALLNAIHQAIARSRTALLHEVLHRQLLERYATLSGRERQVLALVVSGLLNKQIAGELQISEITVKAHRGHAMRKMKAHSLPELVCMAIKLGVIPMA